MDSNDNDVDEIATEKSAFVHGEPPQDGNIPPEIHSTVENLHDNVRKQIMKEGHGKIPSKYSTCFLHYKAWTARTNHKFEDTWLEQRPIELILGKEKKELVGLGVGVSSMKCGEHALLQVGWEVGYGREGSFSFPNVPPMSDIIFEVELIGFDETKEGKSRGEMTAEERIGAADRRRMDGNLLFKEEKLESAMQQYEMSADGDLIDCVHFAHQPAFDHPLLRNHTFQTRPSSHPKEEELGKSSTPRVTQTWRMTGSCPQETIPIRRTTEGHVGRASFVISYGRKRHGSIPLATTITEFNPDTDTGHEHAVAYVKGDEYYGGKAQINVWKPKIENPDEFSLSQMWVLGGSFSDNLNSIEAGWQVNPDLYGDNNTRLFTYWTTDAYKYTGCYNLLCSGFVQVNNQITLGGSISPLSKYHGSQYQITLQIWKDKENGNWWLKFGKDEVVGYWPGEIFSKLKDGGASMVEWGGEVVDMKRGLDGIHTGTQMGSGHFPKEGYKMASYFSNIKVVDHSDNLKDPKHLHTFVTNHRCYTAEIDDKEEDKWGHYFFYGGPGKNPDCP